MNVLLDSHTLIWASLAPHELSDAARHCLSDDDNDLYFSEASGWEISQKSRKLRLCPFREKLKEFELGMPFGVWLSSAIQSLHVNLLRIDCDVCGQYSILPSLDHEDPWDLIIVAHCLAQDIPVVSIDEKLDRFHIKRIW